jgi:hypothetical protein
MTESLMRIALFIVEVLERHILRTGVARAAWAFANDRGLSD